MFGNYVIELWDTSPQNGDARNPSVLVWKMEVYCARNAIGQLYENLKDTYQGYSYEWNSYEKVFTSKPI